jgi:hypothetical protein
MRPLAPLRPLLAALLLIVAAGCQDPGSQSSNPVDDGDSPAGDIKGVGEPQAAPGSSR